MITDVEISSNFKLKPDQYFRESIDKIRVTFPYHLDILRPST